MKQVFNDRLAPITSAIGFLEAPLDDVVAALLKWRRSIHGHAESHEMHGIFENYVHALEPLTGGMAPRELVVATSENRWTATFDCGLTGGDPVTTVGYLARTMLVQGVSFVSIPSSRASVGRPPRFGARQFELFGPVMTDFLNYVRSISLVQDGARWRFDAVGTVQKFERLESYSRRRVQDRFTEEMLADYCAAIGLFPFEEDFFSGPSALVVNPSVPPAGVPVLSLDEARLLTGA